MPYCCNCGNELAEGAAFCTECGTKVANNDCDPFVSGTHILEKACPKCGERMPEDMFYCLNCGYQFPSDKEELNDVVQRGQRMQGTWKNKWISLVLCIFLGVFGAHKFYEGKVFFVVLYLFTLGILGVGVFVDIIRIALKPNPYRVK